jgi:hypothetical protein
VSSVVETRALVLAAVAAFEAVSAEREALEEVILLKLDRLRELRQQEHAATDFVVEFGRRYARARDREDWEARIEFRDHDAHVFAYWQDEIDRVRRWPKRSG